MVSRQEETGNFSWTQTYVVGVNSYFLIDMEDIPQEWWLSAFIPEENDIRKEVLGFILSYIYNI